MRTQAELVADLAVVSAKQAKTLSEIQGLQVKMSDLNQTISELQAIIAAGGAVTPELEAAVKAVADQAQIVDDAIPDA